MTVQRRDPTALADSRLPLPGTSNTRDLAGYPAGPGTVVGAGRLLRGEVLAQPGGSEIQGCYSAVDAADFRGLGLRTVLDLRAEHEMTTSPSAWAEATGADTVKLPIAEGGEGTDTNYVQALLSGAMPRFTEQDMTRFYVDVLIRRATTFAAVVALLADRSRLPALIHCSAGKDRTGLAVALVPDVLGTPREVVLDDYALTGVLRPNRVEAYASRFRDRGVDPENARVLFETPRRSMAEALAELDTKYGGAEGYLIQVGGLSPDVPERLRAVLLVPMP